MTVVFDTWQVTGPCDQSGRSLPICMELLLVLATNTIANFAYAPSGDLLMLIVNGQVFTPVDGSFSMNGQTVVWASPIYSLSPGATVVAIYSTGPTP